MASDEIVWQVINQQFCSFKIKTTKEQNFCRNEYNVTGLCSRQACPLANSRYATVRSDAQTGALYLYMKTVERSHMPSKLWERVRLPKDYSKALELIDSRLEFWPKFLKHKCKQRLTRLTQVAIRSKRLAKEQERLGERVVQRMAPKIRKREEGRERKAEAAAKVEREIERELINRLKSGAYGDQPLNVEESVWKKVLKGLERDGEGTRDQDLDEDFDEEEEERELEYENEGVQFVEDILESDDESNDEDVEDWQGGNSEESEASTGENDSDDDNDDNSSDGDSVEESHNKSDNVEQLKKTLAGLKRKRPDKPPARPPKKGTKGPRREIEYEIETEPPARESIYA